MKKLLFLLMLGLWSCGETIKSPYYVISVGERVYYTKNVIEINNGIKFYSVNAKDTIEIYGSYIKRYVRPQINEINHNDYSR